MNALDGAVWIVSGYLVVGLLFAPFFVTVLVGRIDPDARDGSWGFRIAILPGAIALWPWMIARLVRGSEPRERGPHLDVVER